MADTPREIRATIGEAEDSRGRWADTAPECDLEVASATLPGVTGRGKNWRREEQRLFAFALAVGAVLVVATVAVPILVLVPLAALAGFLLIGHMRVPSVSEGGRGDRRKLGGMDALAVVGCAAVVAWLVSELEAGIEMTIACPTFAICLLGIWLGGLHALWCTRAKGPVTFVPATEIQLPVSGVRQASERLAEELWHTKPLLHALFVCVVLLPIAVVLCPGRFFLGWKPLWVPSLLLAAVFGLVAIQAAAVRQLENVGPWAERLLLASFLSAGFRIGVLVVSILASVFQWGDRLIQVGEVPAADWAKGDALFISSGSWLESSPLNAIPWVKGSDWIIIGLTVVVAVLARLYWKLGAGGWRRVLLHLEALILFASCAVVSILAPMWFNASLYTLGSESPFLSGATTSVLDFSFVTAAWMGLSLSLFVMLSTGFSIFVIWMPSGAPAQAACGAFGGGDAKDSVVSARALSVLLLALGYFGVSFAMAELPLVENVSRGRVEVVRRFLRNADEGASVKGQQNFDVLCDPQKSWDPEREFSIDPEREFSIEYDQPQCWPDEVATRRVVRATVKPLRGRGSRPWNIALLVTGTGCDGKAGCQWLREGVTGKGLPRFEQLDICEEGETMGPCLSRLERELEGAFPIPWLSISVPRRSVLWVIFIASTFLLATLRSRIRLLARDPRLGLSAPWLLLDAETRMGRAVAGAWLVGLAAIPWVLGAALLTVFAAQLAGGGGRVFVFGGLLIIVGFMVVSGRAALLLSVDILCLRSRRIALRRELSEPRAAER